MDERRLPGVVVAVVGIDGSGKTTLAKELTRELDGPGRQARYVENAGGRPPMNWLAQRLGRQAVGQAAAGRDGPLRLLPVRRRADPWRGRRVGDPASVPEVPRARPDLLLVGGPARGPGSDRAARFTIVDANRPRDEVLSQVRGLVGALLG